MYLVRNEYFPVCSVKNNFSALIGDQWCRSKTRTSVSGLSTIICWAPFSAATSVFRIILESVSS